MGGLYVTQHNHRATRTEDVLLSREKLDNFDNECEDIYLLTQREVSLIYSVLRYADWEARWENRDLPYELVKNLEGKLLMLCVRDLVKAQVATVCALTGRSIDLSNDAAVEAFLNSNLDFSEDGITPAIDRLSGASEEQDYTEELTAIAQGIGILVL